MRPSNGKALAGLWASMILVTQNVETQDTDGLCGENHVQGEGIPKKILNPFWADF